jgi:hypothetical protein
VRTSQREPLAAPRCAVVPGPRQRWFRPVFRPVCNIKRVQVSGGHPRNMDSEAVWDIIRSRGSSAKRAQPGDKQGHHVCDEIGIFLCAQEAVRGTPVHGSDEILRRCLEENKNSNCLSLWPHIWVAWCACMHTRLDCPPAAVIDTDEIDLDRATRLFGTPASPLGGADELPCEQGHYVHQAVWLQRQPLCRQGSVCTEEHRGGLEASLRGDQVIWWATSI